ncbi:hypothetical protein [Kocuria rosea]|uniref:hypothetical protein n=1 Tax=Kocuria rosea TaxID=1275 RepID=UPI0011A78BE8|nr:hypothetical protein [Kocuria rosea]
MATQTLETAEPLKEGQEKFLVELWKDSFGVWGSAWTARGHFQFPETLAQLDTIADNDEGITQTQLDRFLEDLRFHSRCRICAGTEDVFESGRCGDCAIALEGEEAV